MLQPSLNLPGWLDRGAVCSAFHVENSDCQLRLLCHSRSNSNSALSRCQVLLYALQIFSLHGLMVVLELKLVEPENTLVGLNSTQLYSTQLKLKQVNFRVNAVAFPSIRMLLMTSKCCFKRYPVLLLNALLMTPPSKS